MIMLCGLTAPACGQDELAFNEDRQEMADDLTACKEAATANDWEAGAASFAQAHAKWQDTVRPMMVAGRAEEVAEAAGDEDAPGKFKEYSGRLGEIEGHFAELSQRLADQEGSEVAGKVNAIIWAISHQPAGFAVGPPTYTGRDWVFGLSIGIGFCIFMTCFGLYLRRSYYRRYARQTLHP